MYYRYDSEFTSEEYEGNVAKEDHYEDTSKENRVNAIFLLDILEDRRFDVVVAEVGHRDVREIGVYCAGEDQSHGDRAHNLGPGLARHALVYWEESNDKALRSNCNI